MAHQLGHLFHTGVWGKKVERSEVTGDVVLSLTVGYVFSTCCLQVEQTLQIIPIAVPGVVDCSVPARQLSRFKVLNIQILLTS